MREFADPIRFAEHLLLLEMRAHELVSEGLESALKLLERDMKDQIGEYQAAVGTYPEWAPLADSTEAQKAAGGYPLNSPLLRTGALRDSFQHEKITHDEGIVGTTDPVMVYHEFGTSKMPPRPVVGPSVEHKHEQLKGIVAQVGVAALAGARFDENYALLNTNHTSE